LKTGWSEPIPAEQNAQMKVLAVLVALSLPSVSEVIVQIVSGPYGVSEARYGITELSQAYQEIRATLRSIHSSDAPVSPSPEACRYCPAKLICPALNDTLHAFRIKTATPLPEGGPAAAQLLDEITVLEGQFAQIRQFYSERLANDPSYSVPDYALVPGSIRRAISDWPRALERLGEFLEPEELAKAANWRLGDLEKALGAKLSISGKPLREHFGEILKGLIEQKQAASSLVRTKISKV
jgi:hypothetical protein